MGGEKRTVVGKLMFRSSRCTVPPGPKRRVTGHSDLRRAALGGVSRVTVAPAASAAASRRRSHSKKAFLAALRGPALLCLPGGHRHRRSRRFGRSCPAGHTPNPPPLWSWRYSIGITYRQGGQNRVSLSNACKSLTERRTLRVRMTGLRFLRKDRPCSL